MNTKELEDLEAHTAPLSAEEQAKDRLTIDASLDLHEITLRLEGHVLAALEQKAKERGQGVISLARLAIKQFVTGS